MTKSLGLAHLNKLTPALVTLIGVPSAHEPSPQPTACRSQT